MNKSENTILIEKLNDQIEKDFLLLGSTAINDDLQDNLKETLDFFLKTGIKIWVLTGDKFDTAKSIAFSSKLISPNNRIYEFNEIEDKDILHKELNRCILNYDEEENKNKIVKTQNKNIKENKEIIEDNKSDSFVLVNESNEINPNEQNNKMRYSIIIGSEQLQIIQSDEILENKVREISQINK